MNFINCIKQKYKQKLIKPDDFKKIQDKYNKAVESYKKKGLGEIEANEKASKIVTQDYSHSISRKQNDLAHARKRMELDSWFDEMTGGDPDKFEVAFIELLEQADTRSAGVFNKSLSPMVDLVKRQHELSTTFKGAVDSKGEEELFENIVRHIFGESVEGDASKFGAMVKKAFEEANTRYTKAGGILGEIDKYFPQFHDRTKIKGVEKAEWVEYTHQRIDWEKTVDMQTGLPFDTVAKQKSVLEGTYDNIVSNGALSRKRLADSVDGDSLGVKSRDISEKNAKSRFLHFKNADSLIDYNNQFGRGSESFYNTITEHLKNLSSDTALLEKMGTRPDRMMKYLTEVKANRMGATIGSTPDNIYKVITGRVDIHKSDNAAYKALAVNRGLLRASMLGGANISAIGDLPVAAMAARVNGISAMKMLPRIIKNFVTGSDKEVIEGAGYIAEYVSGVISGKVIDTGNAGGLANKLASGVIRASGLARWTKAVADAITLEFQSSLAGLASKGGSLDSIANKEVLSLLKRFGITDADWSKIKKVKPLTKDGAPKFLASNLIDDVDVAAKLEDVVHHLRKIATNEPSARVKAALTQGQQKGTLTREGLDTIGMFKSFPISIYLNNISPMFKKNQLAYTNSMTGGQLAELAVAGALTGALVIQLKEVVKGRTPVPLEEMAKPNFIVRSMLQAGTFGLVGDFLLQDASYYNSSVFSTPVTGQVDDLRRLTLGNAMKAGKGEKTNFARDAVKYARRYTPFTNLWYTRQATDKLIWDQLERLVDPKFDQKQRRRLKKIQRKTGQTNWWGN